MPDYRIEFQELGDCIEFVDSVVRNQPKLRIKREQIGIDVRTAGDEKVFAVIIEGLQSSVGEELRCLARCPGFASGSGGHGGNPLKLNQLLERVKLTRQPRMPSGRPLAILLFGAGNEEFRNRYTELMDMGCRGIQVGIVEALPGNQNLTHVFLVESSPRGFWPPAEWSPRVGGVHSRTVAVACYRLRSAEACKLYVEWSYEYPVERIEQLYDFEHPPCHSVFALNGSDDVEGVGAQWLRLRQEDYGGVFSLGEQKLTLELGEPLSAVDLQSVSHADELPLDFQVQREARGANSSLDALETQIASHQQAIADLQRDYRVAHALRRQAIYLAYVFEQDLQGNEDKPPPISTTFARFLQQPYSQLANMNYGFYEKPGEPGRALHVVFDTRPETHMQLLISLADEVYVQRNEWREWNLPLFVRRGDDLRPRLENEDFKPLVRDLLWESQDHPFGEPILLRTLPRHEAEIHGSQWEALYIGNTKRLTDSGCLQFLNRRFSGNVLEFRTDIPAQLAQSLESTRVVLSTRCMDLETKILEVVEDRVKNAEAKWTGVDKKIVRIVRETDEHSQAVIQAQSAIASFPEKWVKFVLDVLTAHKNLHERKITAAEVYGKVQQDLTELLEAHESAMLDVKWQVSRDIEAVERHQETYQTIEQQAGNLMGTLSGKVAEFRQVQEQIKENVKRLNRDAEQQIKTIKDELSQTRERKVSVENRLRVVERLRDELCQEEQRVEDETTRTDEAVRELQEKKSRLETLRNDLCRKQSDLDSLEHEVETLRSDYNIQNPIVQQRQTKLDNDKQQIDQQIAQLIAQRQALDHQAGQFKNQKLEIDQLRDSVKNSKQRIEDSKACIKAAQADCQADRDRIVQLMTDVQLLQLDLKEKGRKLAEERTRHAELQGSTETKLQQVEGDLLQEKMGIQESLEQFDAEIRFVDGKRAALQRLAESLALLSKAVESAKEIEDSSESEPFEVEVSGKKAPEFLEELRNRLNPN